MIYRDDGLLIGPLRMKRVALADRMVWVYCWDDPGVKERVTEEIRAYEDTIHPRDKHR